MGCVFGGWGCVGRSGGGGRVVLLLLTECTLQLLRQCGLINQQAGHLLYRLWDDLLIGTELQLAQVFESVTATQVDSQLGALPSAVAALAADHTLLCPCHQLWRKRKSLAVPSALRK